LLPDELDHLTPETGARARGLMRYRADLWMIGFLVVYNLFLVAGFAAWDQLGWTTRSAVMVLLCAMAFSVATITHNVVHAPMFRSRAWNRAAQIYLSILYGNPVSVFVRGHNWSHHRHTQKPKDLMRTTKARFRWNFLNQALFPALVIPAIEGTNRVFIARERAAGTRWYRQFVQERRAVQLTTLAAVVLHWQAALCLLLVPRLFGIWCIVGINYVQHDGCDEDHPWNHSRNLVGPLLNLWTFNNGYHGIHHLEPGLHWSLLPEAHARLVKPHLHPALDVPSLPAYLFGTMIWPGRRLRYDGAPVELGPPVPDETWLPLTEEMARDISIGGAGT
jgi:fatty acid desaturase